MDQVRSGCVHFFFFFFFAVCPLVVSVQMRISESLVLLGICLGVGHVTSRVHPSARRTVLHVGMISSFTGSRVGEIKACTKPLLFHECLKRHVDGMRLKLGRGGVNKR